jgi:hypothetical protein
VQRAACWCGGVGGLLVQCWHGPCIVKRVMSGTPRASGVCGQHARALQPPGHWALGSPSQQQHQQPHSLVPLGILDDVPQVAS